MTVCKYWQTGNCRFGDSCKNEHPPRTSGGFQTQNRFVSISNGGNMQNNTYAGANSLPYMLKAEGVSDDLTKERPQWILSAYGPGRGAPIQLFGGMPREQSFEEIRLLHYKAVAEGNPQRAVQEVEALIAQSEQQMQQAIANIDGAIKYIIDGANVRPNRLDIISNGSTNAQTTTSSTNAFGQSQPALKSGAFGQASQPMASSSAFGQPSALGSVGSGFGRVAMGGSAFGQASQLGPGVSTFSQPSQNVSSGSAFGQPSMVGASSGFGSPSTLGSAQASPWGLSQTTTQVSSPFGQSSAAAPTSSAFGQPSQLGSTSAFGQPSALGSTSAFGKPSSLGANAPSPFGSSANTGFFGQSSSTPTTSSPFAQAAVQPSTGGFGNFGQPSTSQPSSSPFGRPSQVAAGAAPQTSGSSPFGTAGLPLTTSSFGAPSQPAAVINSFGVPAAASQPSANPFAPVKSTGTNQPMSFTGPTKATRDSSTNKLLTFHDRPVFYPGSDRPQEACFKRPDGKWEKIWFPDGPPVVRPEDTELPLEVYDDTTKKIYQDLKSGKGFGEAEGGMPWLPPRREWCSWDF